VNENKPPARRGAFLLLLIFVASAPAAVAPALAGPKPDILLVTLDTTRADALGSYGAPGGSTPALDALAASGVRFERAYSPAPLTLPAHASLFTGKEPAEHGLRDNGWGRLEAKHALLAERLRAAGYRTAGFPASRVLDARFGLGRGFELYDDAMAAERVGEYGYPERPAAEVVDAALAWLKKAGGEAPIFVWVHFYDPHAPYQPPSGRVAGGEKEAYAAELAYVDRELGRLLAGWPAGRKRVVAAVADHGEAFGEHGEKGHGLLLHEPTLRVPLLLAGEGLAPAVVKEPVAAIRLAATLLKVAGLEGLPGKPLPQGAKAEGAPAPIFHETLFPGTAFGWSPLAAITSGFSRVVKAPRPEIYDLEKDPAESRNLIADAGSEQRKASRELEAHLKKFPLAATPPLVDAEVAAELRSLGYLSGQSREFGELDPKDGVALLEKLKEAGQLEGFGQIAEAKKMVEELVAKSPKSIPFLARLAGLQGKMKEGEAALVTLDKALKLSPQLDFLHLERGDLLLAQGKKEEAAQAYKIALGLHPRLAKAWLKLAEMELRAGRPEAEEKLLKEAVEAGTASAAIEARLGEVNLRRGNLEVADRHLEAATRLLPQWSAPWKLWAQVARQQGKNEIAAEREERARRP
jgi:choline-sulfatase